MARPKKLVQPKVKQTNYAKEEAAEWIAGVFQPKNFLKAGKFIAILIALFLVVRMVGCAVGGIQKKLNEKPKTSAVVKEEKKIVVKKIEKSEPKVVEVKKAQDIKAESSDHRVRLVVRAVKDAAIQVKADGKNIFQTTMKKGTMESWDAEREIVLSGKNINELDMEVNGSHVGTLGNDQRRARKVRITKEGLTVNK